MPVLFLYSKEISFTACSTKQYRDEKLSEQTAKIEI